MLLLGALGVLALLFWDAPILWPVKIVVVLFHELGHAIAAWATGGEVEEIGLSAREGGHTLTRGGLSIAILNAGYLGSLLAGLGLLGVTRTERSARIAAWGLPVVMALIAIALIRPIIGFGFIFTLVAAVAFAAIARYGSSDLVRWILRGLGVFSVLYALFDVRDDVFYGSGGSDAHMLAEVTMIPAFVWGLGWIALGAVLLWAARRWIA